MSGRVSESQHLDRSRPSPDARQAMVEDLARTLAPLAVATGSACAYLSEGRATWLAASAACPCSNLCPDAMPCTATAIKGRHTECVEVAFEGKHDGDVFVCCPTGQRGILGTVSAVVENAARQSALQREKDYLQGELSASRESLEAVYEISSNLRSVDNTPELLKRILDRATRLHPGTKAILWLVNNDSLDPKASRDAPPVVSRSLQSGLVGKTLANRASILLNGRSRLATLPDLEPELAEATSVAIVPIVARKDLLGALEIWHTDPRVVLDSRMLYLLETLALLVAMVVENDSLQHDAIANARLRHDVEIGSRIQQMLLLGRTPVDLDLIRAAAMSIASMQIDGDFYDFVEYDQNLDVIVGDVMGKGIAAALVGAATKNAFMRAMNYLLASRGGAPPEPKEILSIVNAELVKQLIGIESYVTLCYARFDLKTHVLSLIDCGHTRTIHINSQSGQYNLLQGDNMPVGFSRGEIYEPIAVPFSAGDMFLFYSDGVTEMPDQSGEQYGEVRLAELVLGNCYSDPKELVEIIRRDVLAFSKAETFRDDLTCVAVRIQDMEATIPSKRAKIDVTSDMASLGKVRSFVREFCIKNIPVAFPEEDLDLLELAVTEALTNVIRHAYQGQNDRAIRVQADLFLNRVSIRLFHRGQAFDGATDIEAPEKPSEGGMGLYIIQQSVDKVRYYRSKHGENCIHLLKQFKLSASGGKRSGNHP